MEVYRIFLNGLFSYDVLYSTFIYRFFSQNIFHISHHFLRPEVYIRSLKILVQNFLVIVKILIYKKYFQNDSHLLNAMSSFISFWIKAKSEGVLFSDPKSESVSIDTDDFFNPQQSIQNDLQINKNMKGKSVFCRYYWVYLFRSAY